MATSNEKPKRKKKLPPGVKPPLATYKDDEKKAAKPVKVKKTKAAKPLKSPSGRLLKREDGKCAECKKKDALPNAVRCEEHQVAARKEALRRNGEAWRKRKAEGKAGHHLIYRGRLSASALVSKTATKAGEKRLKEVAGTDKEYQGQRVLGGIRLEKPLPIPKRTRKELNGHVRVMEKGKRERAAAAVKEFVKAKAKAKYTPEKAKVLKSAKEKVVKGFIKNKPVKTKPSGTPPMTAQVAGVPKNAVPPPPKPSGMLFTTPAPKPTVGSALDRLTGSAA